MPKENMVGKKSRLKGNVEKMLFRHLLSGSVEFFAHCKIYNLAYFAIYDK